MQSVGIVRRIDDLGRVVIPKGIRNRLGLSEGTQMELLVEDKKVILQKYTATDSVKDRLNELKSAFYECHADFDNASAEKIEKCIKELTEVLKENLNFSGGGGWNLKRL